jgi:phospholipid transport system substrate-binding protein
MVSMKNALAFSMFTLLGVAAIAPAQAHDLRTAAPGTNLLVHIAAPDAMSEGAKNFIASMGDRGINFLGNTAMSQEAKKAEFRDLLNESFDMSTIGRFALGTYWKSATPAQQKEYQRLFNDMIVKVYAKRFSDYKGQKFDVRSARKENDKDAIVTSYIIPSDGPEVKVDWRVRNKGGSYKVVDIVVEGVSMSQTQRSDFASVIQRGGGNVEVLLSHLRQQ